MTETNPLYARPLSTSYQADLFSIKDDHPEPCAACGGLTYEVMIATFTEETSDEDPLYPGRSAARTAAHGGQPLSESVRFVTGTLSIELEPFQRAVVERVFADWQPGAFGHRDHPQPVPDDLEPELDPERVTHSIDEPYAVVHTYDDAVLFAQQLADNGYTHFLAFGPHPPADGE